MAPPTHRTPLRRISQSSLSALHRSSLNHSHPAPTTALDFLAPVLADLADEADALQHNLEQLNGVYEALGTFNEAFASYLYALRMNAFCVEWHQAPAEESFLRAREAAEKAAGVLSDLPNSTHPPTPSKASPVPDKTRTTATDAANTTYATTFGSPSVTAIESKSGIPKPQARKKPAAKKLTGAEKKKRDAELEKIVSHMPIEYRGNDPELRKAIEAVISRLMDAPSGLKLPELVKPPDLPQARVNKCLIALVTKKVVKKTSERGVTLYTFMGVPS